MSTWPLIQRNKVEDSKINIPVEAFAQSEHQNVADLAKKVRRRILFIILEAEIRSLQLLEQWANLEYAYRIPKRVRGVRGNVILYP